MVDQSEQQAARSRLLQALRLYTGEAIVFYVLTVSIAVLLGEVPGWLLFLAIPMAVGWLSMGLLERIRLKPAANPQLTAQKIDRVTVRVAKFRRQARILLVVELAALVVLVILRLSGNLTPPVRFP
jgi:F0F1-type ATP synthase assembly protein I